MVYSQNLQTQTPQKFQTGGRAPGAPVLSAFELGTGGGGGGGGGGGLLGRIIHFYYLLFFYTLPNVGMAHVYNIEYVVGFVL